MNSKTMTLWAPRVMGLLLTAAAFFFAMALMEDEGSFSDNLRNILIHLMPALILLTVVILSWKKPLAGGLFFILLAVAYGIISRDHMDWVLFISLPLFVTGVLFLVSYMVLRKIH